MAKYERPQEMENKKWVIKCISHFMLKEYFGEKKGTSERVRELLEYFY